MKKKTSVRMAAGILSFIMLATSFPTASLAEEIPDMETITQDVPEEEESLEEFPTEDSVLIDEISDEEPDPADDVTEAGMDEINVVDPSGYPEFTPEPVLIDNVKINATAPCGVFPEGAFLYAEKVPEDEQEKAESAVDEVRDNDKNVAVSYTFDIRILAADGETELEPGDEKKVSVSFTLDEAADENLETQVYHVTEDESTGELSAEQLEIITDEDNAENDMTVTVETDGFSYYTVEFTYDSLEYVMSGDSSVPLNGILDELGLTGEVTEVEVSNSSLFEAVQDISGDWTVISHKSFDTKEWIRVTIAGVVYEITVTDDNSGYREVSEWAALKEALGDVSISGIKLSDDIEADDSVDSDSRLKVKGSDEVRNVTIDLNGHTINRNLSSHKRNGHVIEVLAGANLTITNTGTDKIGMITGGYAGNGGGIYVNKNAKLILLKGTIEKNNARDDGGGIYVENGGTLIFDGGSVCGNNAGEDGGGICVCGTLETSEYATGGFIDSNSAEKTGGGIYVNDDGVLSLKKATVSNNTAKNGGGLNVHMQNDSTIDDCVIKENRAGEDGGGLRLNSKGKSLTITDTDIRENKTNNGDGGGICLCYGSINMTGTDAEKCSINNNTSQNDGGGVYVSKNTSFNATNVTISTNIAAAGGGIRNKGTTQLSDCIIESNHAEDGNGGGVRNDNEITVIGGKISGNETQGDYNGNGIYVDKNSEISIGGSLVVKDNGQSNKEDIYLREGELLQLSTALAEEARIGVTLSLDGDGLGVFTSGYKENNPDIKPDKIFFSPEGYSVYQDDNGEAFLGSSWKALQDELNTSESITLTCDHIAGPKETALQIPKNKKVEIDLAGHTLNRNRHNKVGSGHVIEVQKGATLTITDSSESKSGMITGGWSDFGGGIYVHGNGNLFLNGGTITKNKANVDGGGIYMGGDSELILNGGTVSDNYAYYNGGGVYTKNQLTVDEDSPTVSTVTGNVSGGDGGGIYVDDGKINLKNATIFYNTAGKRGGGLYLHLKDESTIKDCIINGENESGGNGGGLYMNSKGVTLTVTDTLIEGNSSGGEGGGILLYNGTIDMKKTGSNTCSLSENTSEKNGGGISVSDDTEFIANGVTFSKNKSNENGGGICNSGTTTIEGCNVFGNSAGFDGGGVYTDKDLIINDGTVIGKIDDEKKGNTAANRGGGICIDSDADTVNISGKITATGNSGAYGKDLFVDKKKKLTLTDEITGTQIGSIYMREKRFPFTENYSFYYPYKGPESDENHPKGFFGTDEDADHADWDNDKKEAKLESEWGTLVKIFEEKDEGTITISEGYTGSSEDGFLCVGAGKTLTIDLNGHTLDRGLMDETSSGCVIVVSEGANLTITDTSESKSGTITGGWSTEDGGGILVKNGATLKIQAGNIRGNRSNGDGGGIHVEKGGTLIFDGGTVSNNRAGGDGGGMCVFGTLKTSDDAAGGTIDGNSAKKTGGGIYVNNDGVLTLEKATVSNNTADDGGGGINAHLKEDSSIQGCTVAGNSSNEKGGGIRLYSKHKLSIEDTIIECNNAQDGGGIYVRYGTVDMTGGRVTDNTALDGGGGIRVRDDHFTADNVTIGNNHALDEDGGGIKNSGNMTLVKCDISGNTSKGKGGGVFTDDGDMELTDCRIHDNSSKDDGGGIYNDEKITLSGGSIFGNISHNNGGGIYVGESSDSVGIEGDLWVDDNMADIFGNDVCLSSSRFFNINRTLTLTEPLTGDRKIGVDLEGGTGTITKNYHDYHPEEDPGKYFFARGFNLKLDSSREVEITSSWSDISTRIQTEETYTLDRDYTATDRDEGFKIYDGGTHVIDLNGHTLNLNRKAKNEEGHVFMVGNGSTLTIKDNSEDKRGTITGGWSDFGGGIFVEKGSKLELQGGAIAGNRADKYGGAVYVDGTFNQNGGAVKNNSSHGSGSGVYITGDGIMKLKKGLISGNRTDETGGGIFCSPDSELQVSGKPIVKDNHAKLKGSDIWLPKNTKIIITDEFMPGASLYVAMEEELGEFTRDYDNYNRKKDPALFFMSAEGYSVREVSGEAVLDSDNFGETESEKPFICREDQVKTSPDLLSGHNWMSGISGERYLHEINMPGSHDSGMKEPYYCYPDHTTVITLPKIVSSFSQTQKEYIDRQLEEGARQLDIRLNDQKKKRKEKWYGNCYEWDDDGKNLWIGHGTGFWGHYPALDPDENFLSFDKVLDWVKVFLRKHPTETVILNLRDETTVSGHEKAIADRARQILTDRALETNPSTGESYLYKEKGSDDYFAEYTDMPKLKDCRGKIVIMVEDGTFHKSVGGFSRNDDIVEIIDNTHYKKDGTEKVNEIITEYEKLNKDENHPLPNDASKRFSKLWYWELNCTGEDHLLVTYGLQLHPLDYAGYVNPRVIGDENVFNPGLAGQYIGWVRMDDFKAEYAETIWQTNFFDELDYKKVTVKSGLDHYDYPDQEFRVLKGTKIMIPGNIYKELPKGMYFEYWKDGTNPDTEGEEWYDGDEFIVNEDVTFTARWRNDGEVPVSIVWNDGNDLDRLRGDSVEMTVTPKEGEPRTIELTSGKHWRMDLMDADADSDVIVPAWDRIKTDVDPNGQDREGEYRYELTHEAGSGFVFTFTHTPVGRTDIKGTIEWDDDNNADKKRPKSVTVRLFANGESTNRTIKVTPDGQDQWKFDFGEQPLYENAGLINYSVTEDDIKDYSISVRGLNITNSYKNKSKDRVEVEGTVKWDDDGNVMGKRPDSVTVILKANNGDAPEVKPVKVKADENGQWKFVFKDLPASDPSGKPGNKITYNIAVNDIPDYTVVVKNVSYGDSSEDIQGIIAFEAECTLNVDPGEKKDPEVTREPEAVTRTYNGKEQTLIKKGTCTGGTFMYAITKQGGSVPDDKSFSEKLPVATDAGTYTVWYFVKGDLFHNDTEKTMLESGCTIDKRNVIFTGISATRKYTGHLQKINEIKVDGLVSGQTHNVVYEAKGTDIGVYKGIITSEKKAVIRSGDKVVTGNYEITVTAGELTIVEDPKLRLEVEFDTQGGKPAGIEPVEDITAGETITLPADPYKKNCDFDGWYTKPGGEGTKFTEETPVVKNMVLYAFFIPHGFFIKGLSESGYVYTGSPIIPPSVEVYDYKTLLTAGKDYTISYRNNTGVAGKDSEKAPTVTVTGKGNYSGTVTETFPITAKNIEEDDVTVSEIASAAYNKAKAYTPVPTITFNKKKLANKKDFEVRYYADKKCSGNTVVPMEPKKYYAKISGTGNYSGTRVLEFVIASTEEIPVSKLTIGKIADIQYDDGEPVTPALSVKDGKTELKQGEDYDIAYRDNKEIGTASVVISGKGIYVGKRTVTFNITGTSLKKVPLTGFVSSIPFTDGSRIEQAVTLQKKGEHPLRGISKEDYDQKELNEKRAYDYTIEYADNVEIGTATMTLTGVNGYFDQIVKTFKITGTNISSAKITGFKNSFDYDGNEHEQNIQLTYKNKDLTKDQDYTVEYLNNKDIGTATMTISGINKWYGSVKKTFKIIGGTQISKATITGFIPSVIYNGSEITQEVSLSYNGQPLTKDQHYTVVYEKNTNAGTASMIINGKGEWFGSVKKTFKITPYDISADTGNKINITTESDSYYYAKSGVKPKPTVKFGDTVLTEGKDYTLAYANNTAVNTATGKTPTIKVTGKGNFTKTNDKTNFNIVPSDMGAAGLRIVTGNVIYTAKPGNWKTTVSVVEPDGKKLTANKDYTVKFTTDKAGEREIGDKEIISAGTFVYVHVKAKEGSCYSGELKGSYRIYKYDISKLSVTLDPKTYTGTEIKLQDSDITWKSGKNELKDVTFKIDESSYKNNVNKGIASVTVKGTGNCVGSKTISFTIGSRNIIWWWSDLFN